MDMTNEEDCRVFSVFRPDSRTLLDYYVTKFDANSSVDFKNCPARMERENNFKEFKSMYGTDTDLPTSGAGSEYGREKREEARRKKFGFKARQYDPKSQPFILKMGAGKEAKKMKGTKNGGVAKNAGYVAFVLTPQKSFISLPVSDWYNFAPVAKRVTLNIEEAEEQFSKRDKIYNHFAIMSNKKKDKREEEEDDDEDFEGKPAKRQKRNSSKNVIETMSDSGEESESDDEGALNDDDRRNKKRKRNEKSEDDETVEENDEDEGVDEGRELDYLSEASDDEDPFGEDMEELKEFGLEEDEEERLDDKNNDEEDSDKEIEEENGHDSDSDEDVDDLFGEPSAVKESVVKGNTSADRKRKSDGPESAVKKPKLDANPVGSAIDNMEDFVRDCLTKKPTSATELMKKVASQFSKSHPLKELKEKLIVILKKLTPRSKNIEGTAHLFL